MKEKYNKEYYTTKNYENYLNKCDRYQKLAIEIFDLFNKICILQEKKSKILDYGCAVGFLLDGIRKIGYDNLYAYDISEWALSRIKNHKILKYEDIFNNNFDATFMLDVLEHMEEDEIKDLLSKLSSEIIIVRIPVALETGKNFLLEVSRADDTHVNCKTKSEWIKIFKDFGYDRLLKINLNNIYDSDGVFCAIFFKNME